MIGVIVKTGKKISELPEDWEPEPIDILSLKNAFNSYLGYKPKTEEFCHDKGGALIYFTIDSFVNPKSVTFNCTFNELESVIIRNISNVIEAKIYDSEACDFI